MGNTTPAKEFKVGALVAAKYSGTDKYYPAAVVRKHSYGRYDVKYMSNSEIRTVFSDEIKEQVDELSKKAAKRRRAKGMGTALEGNLNPDATDRKSQATSVKPHPVESANIIKPQTAQVTKSPNTPSQLGQEKGRQPSAQAAESGQSTERHLKPYAEDRRADAVDTVQYEIAADSTENHTDVEIEYEGGKLRAGDLKAAGGFDKSAWAALGGDDGSGDADGEADADGSAADKSKSDLNGTTVEEKTEEKEFDGSVGGDDDVVICASSRQVGVSDVHARAAVGEAHDVSSGVKYGQDELVDELKVEADEKWNEEKSGQKMKGGGVLRMDGMDVVTDEYIVHGWSRQLGNLPSTKCMYSVSVDGFQLLFEDDNPSLTYVSYYITCRTHSCGYMMRGGRRVEVNAQWQVLDRFRNFRRLHIKIKEILANSEHSGSALGEIVAVPEFPSRTLMNMSSAVLRRRQADLTGYLRKLQSVADWNVHVRIVLDEFLDVCNAQRFIQVNDRQMLEYLRAMDYGAISEDLGEEAVSLCEEEVNGIRSKRVHERTGKSLTPKLTAIPEEEGSLTDFEWAGID